MFNFPKKGDLLEVHRLIQPKGFVVYKIYNVKTKKLYIGQSSDFFGRLKHHFLNYNLKKDNKLGNPKHWKVKILEHITRENLSHECRLSLEQYHICLHNLKNPLKVLNKNIRDDWREKHTKHLKTLGFKIYEIEDFYKKINVRTKNIRKKRKSLVLNRVLRKYGL